MDTNMWIIVVAVLLGVIAILGALLLMRERRSRRLQSRFGPEYERTVRQYGDQKHAEEELTRRESRVTSFRIVPLSREDRAHFAEGWRRVQNGFVDDPKSAVMEADRQVRALMERRGYPMTDFEQRAADLSVDHASVVEHYRSAHQIALRQEGGTVGTEDLRKAIIHYRAIFDELLDTGAARREVREAQRKGGLKQWTIGRNIFRRQI